MTMMKCMQNLGEIENVMAVPMPYCMRILRQETGWQPIYLFIYFLLIFYYFGSDESELAFECCVLFSSPFIFLDV